jgi:TrmH family RNA methyltransferase
MKLIQSRDNLSYKNLVKIATSARQRAKAQQTLLDGTHLLAAYLDAGMQPQQVLVNVAASHDAEIAALLSRLDDSLVTQLDDRLFDALSELKTPTGILSLINVPHLDSSIVDSRFALLLEDIQDPGNLGSIIRSAAAAGCDTIYLSKSCADAWSPKVLRAAMGGHFELCLYERQDLQYIAQASSSTLLATSLQATHSLYDCELSSGDIAIMVGNEGAGLSDALLQYATQSISIPMQGSVESLNVAAATAICLYEVARQRL